uniref:ABC transporter domain-containing protein n=1 Tax=Cannabis sativa TaxID=3483 RepID=A0A803PVW1_CANSA
MASKQNPEALIEINGLRFTYPGIDGHPPPGSKPLIDNFSLTLNSGDRCLLVGSNGAGKTTILKILGGKHMVEPHMVRVLGRSAFHDTALTSSGDLCYLGGEWRRDVAFAGFEVAIQMDISAEKLIFGVAGIDPQRRAELLKVLDIDLSWRMHKVSDGQRRRVQICMGLLKPFKVLLLDEITVDLDVLARADLLKFLRKECEEKGATIIYATHIFDGLEDWPSHIVYVAKGTLQLAMPMDKVKEISKLSLMIDGSRVAGGPRAVNNGWAAGRLNSTVAGEDNFVYSSNRVLRQSYTSARGLGYVGIRWMVEWDFGTCLCLTNLYWLSTQPHLYNCPDSLAAKGCDLWKKGVRWLIGKGDMVQIREDAWIPNVGRAYSFRGGPELQYAHDLKLENGL